MESIAVNTIAIIFQMRMTDGSRRLNLRCEAKKFLNELADMDMAQEQRFVLCL